MGRFSFPSFGLMLMSYLAKSVFCGAAHLIDNDVSVLSANSTDAIPTGTENEDVELTRLYPTIWLFMYDLVT